MPMKIAIAVTNDLSTDQRVQRTVAVAQSLGMEVTFIGRHLPNSVPFNPGYSTLRFRLWFKKGALFYANYNLRLFWHLLFTKYDGYIANDLDTLLAIGLASKFRGKPFIYDSHEFFTGVPEIQHSSFIKGVWGWIEKRFYHKAQSRVTVNASIARLLREAYGGETPYIVRNIGLRPESVAQRSRAELGLPENTFIFINQGAGINVERGMEEAVEAIQGVDGAVLLIVGNGDAVPGLKKYAEENNLKEKVIFIQKMPYAELLSYTQAADVGLSLDKPTSLNYMYSLPNKLFDYIHSGLPVLGSQVVEVKRIIQEYQVGRVVDSTRVSEIQSAMKEMMREGKAPYQTGLEKAKNELTWDSEAEVLKEVLNQLINSQK